MNVEGHKISLKDDIKYDLLNLKLMPEYIGILRSEDWILPAYHMDKDNWISIVISKYKPDKNIYNQINESYQLTR